MKVLLLAGGVSGERQVSLTSGQAVYDALKRLKHTVFAVDPSSGRSLIGNDGKFIGPTPQAESSSAVAEQSKPSPRSIARTLSSPGFDDVDVVFIALHGGAGEDGTIQCLLDLAGKKYTGSGMAASAVAMDKAIAKRIFAAENIRTPEWRHFQVPGGQVTDELVDEVRSSFELPIIVKPNNGGSTIGLTLVRDAKQLRPALAAAASQSSGVLVENYIKGRELTVAVFDGKAYPVVEIRPTNELYDYEAKYTKGKSNYIAPAEVDESTAKEVQAAAERAFDAIGAAGLARVDFILGEDNQSYCLEVNTLPGMTALSLAPMSLKAAGVEFDELIQLLIESGLKRSTK